MEEKKWIIDQIREFNRFYTVLLGFLNRDYLDSGYSVTEMRILFELKQNRRISANRLTEMLHLDKSYISRLIRSFEQKGLLVRHTSSDDGRALIIRLTPKGESETDSLIDITNHKIYELVSPLTPETCKNLSHAMKTIIESFYDNTDLQEGNYGIKE